MRKTVSKLPFLATLFAMSATSADFRGLDFGQSCSTISEWEAAHGSSSTQAPAPRSGEAHAFSVEQFNRVVVATYYCVNGNLVSGGYFFPVESWTQATDTYRATYEALRKIYGDPLSETLPWGRKEDGEAPSFAHPRAYITSWNAPRVFVAIDVVPSDIQATGWRVHIAELKNR